MSEQITYSNTNEINIAYDNIIYSEGTVEQDTSLDRLILDSGASCGFLYEKDYHKGYAPDRIKFEIQAWSEDEFSTRYNTDISILIKVRYYEKDGDIYSEGNYSSFELYPTLESESPIYYGLVNSFELILEQKLVYSIYIEFRNNSDSEIIFSRGALFKSITLDNALSEAVGFTVTLREVRAYIDGCELYYDNSDEPDKLWWMEDNNGDFCGINVNNTRIINFRRINEILLD